MSTTQTVLDLDELCTNTMRTLAIDAIQQANSGHPGTPWVCRRQSIACGKDF